MSDRGGMPSSFGGDFPGGVGLSRKTRTGGLEMLFLACGFFFSCFGFLEEADSFLTLLEEDSADELSVGL